MPVNWLEWNAQDIQCAICCPSTIYIKGWINKELYFYESKNFVESEQQDKVSMQERRQVSSVKLNSRLGSVASLPRIQRSCLWLEQSEPERLQIYLVWKPNEMENRLPSTEKQVNEQRVTSTIFPALQRSYKIPVSEKENMR